MRWGIYVFDYQQESKNHIRHKILSNSVKKLTAERTFSTCVSRNYVREAIDYFLNLDEDEGCNKEARKIESKYLLAWESLHDATIGYKRPSDLTVCYLSGPQPQNDFNELTSLGVLAQNIWAFEKDNNSYLEALSKYKDEIFPQPKIVKMSVEQFFKQSPKKFDIVYIDACGAIPSGQHALRSVVTLCQYQRLNSPGIVITNFAKPDLTNSSLFTQYVDLVALYIHIKENPNLDINFEDGYLKITGLSDLKRKVQEDFETYYGKFISLIISDIPAVIVPLQRFANIAPFSNLFERTSSVKRFKHTTLDEINDLQNSSVCKILLIFDYINENKMTNSNLEMIKILCNELTGLDGNWEDLIKGTKYFIKLKNGSIEPSQKVSEIINYFKKEGNLYRFLDKPTENLFFDMVINQLTYPLHDNTDQSESYQYCAKQTEMFTDLTVLDECRYIYEWLPAIHQILNAMTDLSWQYVFRFALDGLVKQRIYYNNEFFFQGSVIPKDEDDFCGKKRQNRLKSGG